VGTGINTHPEFGSRFAKYLSRTSGFAFTESSNHFETQGSADATVELSSVLKTTAITLTKIVNDFRWMNSGPNAGLSEIILSPLQPGSSIMPGKVNPVIEEAVAMACAQVIGHDAAIAICGLSGNFELNTSLPLIAHNLLEQIRLLSNASHVFTEKSVKCLKVNTVRTTNLLDKNPILATALNPVVGYDLAAQIAKKASSENRPVKEIARQLTTLSKKELDEFLNPLNLTRGGLSSRKKEE
jgi:fumarate hydratase class II